MKKSDKKYIAFAIGIILAAALVLYGIGRIPFCKCGIISLWSSDVMSSEQSQQFADPYTFTHVIHGLVFYLILWFAFGKRLNPMQRLLIAIGIESAWEIFENTDLIINRYREATISLDYYGDSIFNSVGDIISMVVGYVIAWKLPTWVSIATVIVIELVLLYLIRDNLTINIIMLLHPIEAIKTWQAM